MKHFISIVLASTIFMTACNNDKPKETTIITSPDGKETATIDPGQIQQASEDVERKKIELEKLSPLSLDELKELIPETLLGVNRSNFQVNASMGAGLASGDYKIDESTRFSLNIYDCAGPAGAGIYSMQYLGMFNIQHENDKEYTKSILINGGNAFEHCNKTSNDCSITYFAGGRFMVTLEGDNIGAEKLKQAASELNIK